MNKLEVLYKVFNNIKERESFEGVMNAQAFNGSEEIVNMRNEFSKDIKNGECKLIVNGRVNLPEFKGEIKESFDLNREEMHKKMHEKMREKLINMDENERNEFFEKMGKHHMMRFNREEFMNMDEKDKEEFFKKMRDHHMRGHGREEFMGRRGKSPMKKFGKAAFMLKVLNEMELSEEEDFKIIKLDLNEVKKEMKELKGNHKGKHCHCEHRHDHKSIDELEGIFKLMAIKHKMRKEILFADYDEMTLNLYINKEFNVEKIFIEGKGKKTVNIEVNFR